MTPSARLASAAEILDSLDLTKSVEGQIRAWARNNRYAGSGDRRAIADRVYTCLRRRGSCASQAEGETGRALILGSLILEDGLSAEQIAGLCSGGHGLAPLTEAELVSLGRSLSDDPSLDWPDWLSGEAERIFGSALVQELEALRHRAPLDLRVNTLKATLEDARSSLAAEGLKSEAVGPAALRLPAGAPVKRSAAYLNGWVEPQDLASQTVAAFAGVQSGETVLDYCAGAGGKTLALAAEMADQGQLYAHDIDPKRMDPLPERAKRAGVSVIQARLPRPAGCDCVFVDAPCSGSGSWRRDPAGKWRLSPSRLEALHGVQRQALASAASYVKSGGRLVYVTCSVLPSENADQVAWFLRSHSGFVADKILNLHPFRDGGDGFFAARFVCR